MSNSAYATQVKLIIRLGDVLDYPVVVVDRSFHIVGYNARAKGIMKSLSVPKSPTHSNQFFPDQIKPLIEQLFLTGKSPKIEKLQVEDRVFLPYFAPVCDDCNNVSTVAVLFKDMTDEDNLKRQIAAALENFQELDAILEHSHDGIWIMDGNGVTLKVSKSWEKFSGINRREVIGKSVYEIVKEGYYTDSAAIHVLKSLKPSTIIYKLRTGEEALVTGVPIFNSDGRLWRIISNVRDITELESLRRELERTQKVADLYQREINSLYESRPNKGITIAFSKKMRDLINRLQLAATSEANVLIQGETGTGKEVIARLVHKMSQRCNGPFIKINCGSIPGTLLESELFGFEEGSFTGARKHGKIGLFELAAKGTLFLDEIGELPLDLQPKLLTAIQDRQIMRIGGTESISLDVRIIAATNQDLESSVKERSFRKDLFYRLNVIPLFVPPLRERKEDIVPLANYFLDLFNKKYGTSKAITQEVNDKLMQYEWPGNVRELENVIERMTVTTAGEQIRAEDMDIDLGGRKGHDSEEIPASLKSAREECEREILQRALDLYGSTYKIATALRMNQSTIVRKLQKYGLRKNDR